MVAEAIAIGRVNIDVVMQVDKLLRTKPHTICEGGNISFGGSAANFAMQLTRLGVKAGLVSCIGDDPYGQMALKALSKGGVDTTSTLVLEKKQTGIFFLAKGNDGKHVVFAEPGANRFLEKRVLDEEKLAGATMLHIAGGFPMITNRAVDIATTNGIILSLDPGRAAESVDLPNILRRTDLLFVNEGELKSYFKIDPSKKALTSFAKSFPGILVVKKGKRGAVATDGFEYCSSDVFEVPVADTLGAGDAFDAGFVIAWSRSERIEQALNMANAVAALTITKVGAWDGQPTLDETVKFAGKYGISLEEIARTFRTKKRKKRRKSRT